ncbi:MAG: hypothetical protein JST96_04650, partial [Bacteroidetes bacterium]|nr:hypothetical protein [Bacteroidota bacterium]
MSKKTFLFAVILFSTTVLTAQSLKTNIDTLNPELFMKTRGGLNNSYAAITKNKNATIAFLGGSITYNPGWRDKVCAYL